jgi:hypothetical protein
LNSHRICSRNLLPEHIHSVPVSPSTLAAAAPASSSLSACGRLFTRPRYSSPCCLLIAYQWIGNAHTRPLSSSTWHITVPITRTLAVSYAGDTKDDSIACNFTHNDLCVAKFLKVRWRHQPSRRLNVNEFRVQSPICGGGGIPITSMTISVMWSRMGLRRLAGAYTRPLSAQRNHLLWDTLRGFRDKKTLRLS